MLVNLGLGPRSFFCGRVSRKAKLTGVENEDVVDDTLLSVALSATEDDEVLAELRAGVTVPGRWRMTRGLVGINLHLAG